jgi:hypothetical protein
MEFHAPGLIQYCDHLVLALLTRDCLHLCLLSYEMLIGLTEDNCLAPVHDEN